MKYLFLRNMNHTKLLIMIFLVLACLVTLPVAARVPFDISGYVHFPNGSACLDPTVTITNLNTGDVLSVMTLRSSNYYQADPAPLLNEINRNDVLEFVASAGTDSAVIGHRIMASDLNSGGLDLNITLGTVKTAAEADTRGPPMPQSLADSTQDTTITTTTTMTHASTSTGTPASADTQEKQIPGFEIVPASAAMVACLVWARRRGRVC